MTDSTQIKQRESNCSNLNHEADDLLRALGLEPSLYRTDSGAINHMKVRAALAHPEEYPTLSSQRYAADGHKENQDAFESFVRNELGDIAVMDQGRYISPKISNYWRIWQFARGK